MNIIRAINCGCWTSRRWAMVDYIPDSDVGLHADNEHVEVIQGQSVACQLRIISNAVTRRSSDKPFWDHSAHFHCWSNLANKASTLWDLRLWTLSKTETFQSYGLSAWGVILHENKLTTMQQRQPFKPTNQGRFQQQLTFKCDKITLSSIYPAHIITPPPPPCCCLNR